VAEADKRAAESMAEHKRRTAEVESIFADKEKALQDQLRK